MNSIFIPLNGFFYIKERELFTILFVRKENLTSAGMNRFNQTDTLHRIHKNRFQIHPTMMQNQNIIDHLMSIVLFQVLKNCLAESTVMNK